MKSVKNSENSVYDKCYKSCYDADVFF